MSEAAMIEADAVARGRALGEILTQLSSFSGRFSNLESTVSSLSGGQNAIMLSQARSEGEIRLIKQDSEHTKRGIGAIHQKMEHLDERVGNIERGGTSQRETKALRQNSLSVLKGIAPIIIAVGSAIACVIMAMRNAPAATGSVATASPPAMSAPASRGP